MKLKNMTPAQRKLYVARINDADAAEYAKDPQHGPLPEDATPDMLEEMEMAAGMRVGMDDEEMSDG